MLSQQEQISNMPEIEGELCLSKLLPVSCQILKFQDMACRILKFKDLTCRILKLKDLTWHLEY